MVFLSSARSNRVLAEVRDELKAWAKDSRVDLWQFEKHTKLYWDRQPFQATANTCLRKVDDCDLYIAIFHGAYGGNKDNHAASVALTDLEFFEAISRGKRIRFYIIEPHEPAEELKALLTLVHLAMPDSFGGGGSARHVLHLIQEDIARHLDRPDLRLSWRAQALLSYKSGITRLRRSELDSADGLQVLQRDALRLHARYSANELTDVLGAIDAVEDQGERESHLTSLLPELTVVPYGEHSCTRFLPVWDHYCESWLRATAWRGHHNALRLGRLSMLNTQMMVRCLLASGGDRRKLRRKTLLPPAKIGDSAPWIRAFSLGGALASEYYSLAKEQVVRFSKERFLRRGLEFLHVAIRVHGLMPEGDRCCFFAGLAAIRGHIYLELGDRALDPMVAFEESLKLREEAGMNRVAIAEAKADLGHAMVREGLWRQGHALLAEGVGELESVMHGGFAARAKLKLAECYMRRGRIKDAVQHIREADAICVLHRIKRREVSGSLPRLALGVIRLSVSQFPKLLAEKTKSGYRYRTQ